MDVVRSVCQCPRNVCTGNGTTYRCLEASVHYDESGEVDFGWVFSDRFNKVPHLRKKTVLSVKGRRVPAAEVTEENHVIVT
jgi:hypothetical protein